MVTTKKNKPKYKPKKYLNGTQQLPSPPDYSYYYDAQNDAYNRRVREQVINNTTINPLVDNTSQFIENKNLRAGTQVGNLVGRVGSDVLNQSAINKDNTRDVGKVAAAGALKYGAMGASVGSVAGPIGTVIGGAVGAIGGGLYTGLTASKENRNIRQAKASADNLAQYTNKRTVSQYDPRVAINEDISQEGFARRGKYNIQRYTSKSKSSTETKLNLPDPNRYTGKRRYRDYRKKPRV